MLSDDDIDAERIDLRTSRRNHLPHLLAYIHASQIVRGHTVSDLCCGTGYGTRLLSESAKSVVGYDYSKTAIEYCNKRFLDNVEYRCADVENLSLDTDFITCMQGLEHLDNPAELIRRNKDKRWIFALPNDEDSTNTYHHHKITVDLIRDWFGDVQLNYFDDSGRWDIEPFRGFNNYYGIYTP